MYVKCQCVSTDQWKPPSSWCPSTLLRYGSLNLRQGATSWLSDFGVPITLGSLLSWHTRLVIMSPLTSSLISCAQHFWLPLLFPNPAVARLFYPSLGTGCPHLPGTVLPEDTYGLLTCWIKFVRCHLEDLLCSPTHRAFSILLPHDHCIICWALFATFTYLWSVFHEGL